MTRFRSLGLSLLAAGTLAACDSAETPATGDDLSAVETSALVVADGVVGSRFQPVAEGDLTFRSAASAKAGVSLTPLYNVLAPEGTHATHLTLSDGVLSGSYLIPGIEFGGGFDQIDVSDPGESSNAFTAPYLDLAEVTYRGSDLYTSGSLETEHPDVADFDFESKAIFTRLSSSGTRVVDLSSDFVMDAVYPGSGNYFYAVTGVDGDVYRIHRSSLSAQTVATAYDLRSVAYVDGDLVVLDGAGAVYRTEARKNAGIGEQIHAVEAFTHGAIAKMHVDEQERVYVPNGPTGFDVITPDGELLAQAESGAVKSLVTAGDLVFVANSDGGVLVMQWSLAGDALDAVGVLAFPEGSQVNHVEVDGDTLYVAAGASGIFAIQVSSTPA